jgi:hypothetical protein
MTAAIANTTTTVTAGEGGLGAYIKFCDDMARTCESGFGIAEATLGDMREHGWHGEKTEHIVTAMEQINSARESFLQAKAVLEASLIVNEAYVAQPGTGDRESVTNL